MKKILVFLMFAAVWSWSALASQTAVPMRIGPVSVYGALGTSGSKIVSQKTGAQVMLRGISLDWSDATGAPYYTPTAIGWAVDKWGVDVVRYAMAVQYYTESTSEPVNTSYAYISSPNGAYDRIDRVVATAIENDIYVIIDWHSHRAATYEKSYAQTFFNLMSERYKDVPNIIWEVYNEPVNEGQGTISSYANDIISGIRRNSTNLAIVGTEFYSQLRGGCTGVSQTNSAYVFHFYAHEHNLKDFRSRITSCLGDNKAVFISEWGTTDAGGTNNVDISASSDWTSFMDQNNISNCNWSFRHSTSDNKVKESAMFSGATALVSKKDFDNATLTTSGNFIKSYLTKNMRDWNELYTAGARSGSCAFAHVTASIAEGSVSGKASASCTYTSSNANVATVENGVIKLKSAGVAVMTGNDKTKTVVRVTALPQQTLNINQATCRKSTVCDGNGMNLENLSGQSPNERSICGIKTIEGAEVTIESDNPSVISVKKALCTGYLCYSEKGTTIWMADFKSLGVANLHITAPAVTGYAALDTTIEYKFLKNAVSLNSKYFKSMTLDFGTTLELNKTYAGTSISFSLSNSLATIEDYVLTAGNTPGRVFLVAEVQESEDYEYFKDSVMYIIGYDPDGIIKGGATAKRLNAYMQGSKLQLGSVAPGTVQVRVFDMLGKQVARKAVANTAEVDLSALSNGNYVVYVRVGSEQKILKWSKK